MAIGMLSTAFLADTTAASSVGVSGAYKYSTGRSTQTLYRPDSQSPQRNFNGFIIKYRDGTAARRDRAAAQLSVDAATRLAGLNQATSLSAMSPLSMRYVRKMAVGADVIRPSRPLSPTEADNFLRQLRADPSVAYAQPDFFKSKLDVIPNDTHFATRQWDFTNPTAGMGAPAAWNHSAGEGVVVAVIDTGYVDHADLVSNVVPGYDFVSWYGQTLDGATYPDIAGDGGGRDPDAHDPGDWLDGSESFCGGTVANSSWHGTHVAGTVAAVANNAYGIAGTAYKSKIQPIRALGHCGGLTSDISDAIVWASGGTVAGVPVNPTPAEVVNLSLGGYGSCSDDPATQEAVNGAIGRGVTIVAAAGNANIDASQFSPASCSGVVTVGATGIDGAKSYFSNYGQVVTLAAPGGNARSSTDGTTAWIWSLGNKGTKGPEKSPTGDALLGMIGTSMAAPHVAGVVALMQSASVGAGHGPMAPALVKAVLKAKVKPFAVAPPVTTPLGTGILDAASAVAVAASGIREEDLTLPLTNRMPLSGQNASAGEAIYYRLDVPANVGSLTLRTYGGSGDVSLYIGRGFVPTVSSYTAASIRVGTTEALVLNKPSAGIYYVRMQASVQSNGISVLSVY